MLINYLPKSKMIFQTLQKSILLENQEMEKTLMFLNFQPTSCPITVLPKVILAITISQDQPIILELTKIFNKQKKKMNKIKNLQFLLLLLLMLVNLYQQLLIFMKH